MKLSKEILLSEYPDYPTAVALSFEGKGLTHLKDLSLCPAVEYLSLRFNAIASTREVTACRHLWILDLQQNHLREMDGVGQFAALGTLVITGNELQLSALRPLEGLVLIHLEATFTKGTRKEVGLWIYNGKFISLNERAAYGVSLDIGKRGPIVSHKAKEVLAFLSQETNTVARELKKFTYLIRDLESACELEWQMKTGKNGTKSRGAKFPKFQLKRWECLHYSSKLILCGFLDLYLEGFFPLNFLKLLVETLVTEAFPDSPPILEAMELCELPPHYLLSLIIDLQNSIENETFPPETEAQVQSLWQALNIPFLVAHFDKVQEVLGTTDKSESFINKSAVSGSSNSVVYLSEEENIRVEQNRENLCLFAVTVLVKYGLTPQTEDRSKGNSTSALDGSVFNYVLQYAGVSKSMLKRLEVDKRKEESKLESFSKPSKDFETSNRKELDRFHSFDPQKPDEISIDPFVSDLYPASRYMSGGKEGETSMIATPQMDRTKVRDSMSENMSSIRKELTPSQSPGFSFFAKYKQFDTAPGMQPTPHFQRTQPTPTRPSRPFSEPRDLVESQSGGIIKKKRRNIGIFSAENTWKPHFVLTSEPKVTPGVQWKRIEDPPELFVVLQPSTPYATQTLGVAPMGKTRTGQRSVMQESRLSKSGLIEDRRQNESQRGGVYGEHREESEEEEEQGEEQGEQQREGQGEIREADSSLSVKIIPGSNADEPISVKLFAFDSPLFPPRMDDQTFLTSLEQQNRPKTMNVSASDSLLLRNSLTQISQSQPPKLKVNRIVPSGPWFTVPERIRCVISADPYSIAKAPNFRRDHAMQLPGPPIRPKIKAKLFVSGQGPGQEGVKKNEGVVKWVQHVLKPTLKLKQDQFCLNYAEYLHYDMNRKQMVRLPSVKYLNNGEKSASKTISPLPNFSK